MADFNSRSCEGATFSSVTLLHYTRISTHAPVKERRTRGKMMLAGTYFNSRSCEGATSGIFGEINPAADFNSRSCEGATFPCSEPLHDALIFQLTLL